MQRVARRVDAPPLLAAALLVLIGLASVRAMTTTADATQLSRGIDGMTWRQLADTGSDVLAPGPAAAPAAPTTGWEARAPGGAAAIDPPRPDPILVADDLGAVDPSPALVGSPLRDELPVIHDRRFVTPPSPWLVDPTTPEFQGSIEPVPDWVLRRSTWHEGCPVTADELRWVKVTHVGFDGRAHAGELLVHRDAAVGMVEVFRRLYEARYPIEKMRIAGGRDFSVGPWWHGDDNTTTAFVCRPTVSGGRWSEHAYGLAVDINPFHNPYVKGEVMIPSHADAYLVRDGRPGIIHRGDEVTDAFRQELGWYWGGSWSSAIDWMHFSWNDR